jgi:hypothetical protein
MRLAAAMIRESHCSTARAQLVRCCGREDVNIHGGEKSRKSKEVICSESPERGLQARFRDDPFTHRFSCRCLGQRLFPRRVLPSRRDDASTSIQ